MTLLIIEDDPDARELMQAVLEQRGACVLAADGVTRAFELLDEKLPDVVVSDIAMPDEDGIDFVHRLRARPASRGGAIPAVAVSAYVANADRSRALAAGFDRYLHKPIDFDELVRTILALHSGSRRPEGALRDLRRAEGDTATRAGTEPEANRRRRDPPKGRPEGKP